MTFPLFSWVPLQTFINLMTRAVTRISFSRSLNLSRSIMLRMLGSVCSTLMLHTNPPIYSSDSLISVFWHVQTGYVLESSFNHGGPLNHSELIFRSLAGIPRVSRLYIRLEGPLS